jgi:murein L,D-transpeptidase YafK
MMKRIISIFGIVVLIGGVGCWFWPGKSSAALVKADKVVVIKSKRLLILMRDGEILKAYKIALGKQPKGRKTNAGDRKTPEGNYILDSRNTESKFHKSIHISYPSEKDILNAQKLGVSTGGAIMIHGLPDSLASLGKAHRTWDWTDGCIAVTNPEIEEIWRFVTDGTPIEIKP